MASVPLTLSGIDDALVVRISGYAGGGGRPARKVYVIPLPVLQAFERKRPSSADQDQLDELFRQNKKPKVEAAVVHVVHAFDGA